MMEMDYEPASNNQAEKLHSGNSLNVQSSHYKATQSVHYDTLHSLNKNIDSKSSKQNKLSNHNQTSLQDPYKIIIPTYKSFRNLDDVKDDTLVDPDIFGNIQHLLVAETSDEYLKLAHNNNNYNDDEQPLFLTICVTAIAKLGRSVGAKTNLFKSLDVELKEIIDREIYQICNSYQQQMIQSNQSMIERYDQSILLQNAAQNVFKIFLRVLQNQKTVISVFKQSERVLLREKQSNKHKQTRFTNANDKLQSYTMESVWNGVQKSILNHLLKRYLEVTHSHKKETKEAKEEKSVVDALLEDEEMNDNLLRVRNSPSPSPSSTGNNSKESASFGKRLKDRSFFKRKSAKNYDDDDANEENGNSDLYAINIPNRYHDAAMDALTFSFADSNIGSIVLEEQGLTITNTHIKDKRGSGLLNDAILF